MGTLDFSGQYLRMAKKSLKETRPFLVDKELTLKKYDGKGLEGVRRAGGRRHWFLALTAHYKELPREV